jgi:hypothetical protein
VNMVASLNCSGTRHAKSLAFAAPPPYLISSRSNDGAHRRRSVELFVCLAGLALTYNSLGYVLFVLGNNQLVWDREVPVHHETLRGGAGQEEQSQRPSHGHCFPFNIVIRYYCCYSCHY